jgi:signal transduction histidine kinase
VDLRQLAEAAAELVRRHPATLAATEIVVSGACRPVPGDEDLLHRLAVNLMLNAVQAAGGDVRIQVTVAEEARVDFPELVVPAPAAKLTVTDDGPGLPDDVRARLFQPFTSRRPGGVGLGLAVVHRTVEAHHGLIQVDSAPGAGTTFTVLLPLEGAAQGGA